MGLYDVYDLATMGQNTSNVYTRASMGQLFQITIEDIEIPVRKQGGSSSSSTGEYDRKKEDTEKAKKISVTIEFNGETYSDTAITRNLDISIDDIDVSIDESLGKPRVKIVLLKS